MPVVPIDIPSLFVRDLEGEGIPDADGVELIAYETCFHDSFFDFSA